MRDEPEPIELTVQLIKRSPKAMLVSDGRVRAWLPLSQIESWETENEAKRIYRARIPEWLAKTKGLI